MLDWTQPGKKYAEMAIDFVRLQGIKSGNIPVINRKDHPRQWREWYAYYGFRKLHAIQDLMREKHEKTVPCLSPIDFDAEFMPPAHLPDVPGSGGDRRREPSAEERKRVEILMSNFSGRKVDDAVPNRYERPSDEAA